jgi:sterol 3beta-glucosyltransferase
MAIRKPVGLYFQNRDGRKPSLKNPFQDDRSKLVCCSNHVFSTPEPAFSKGYWFLDEVEGYQPPPDLVEFLDSGEKPVYIGFGSVGTPAEAAQKTRMITEAVAACGRRALIATGYGGLEDAAGHSGEVHVIREAPHAWLFARVAMVVHHGGAGTTAAGMRAGVPSLIVPHANDQFAWGQRVFDLGVGARPIDSKLLTASALAGGIREALQPEVVDAAKAMGERLRAENGAADTARYLVERVQQGSAAPPRNRSKKIGAGLLIMLLAPVLIPLIPGGLFLLVQAIRGVPLAESTEMVQALIDRIKPYAGTVTIFSVVITVLVIGRKLWLLRADGSRHETG